MSREGRHDSFDLRAATYDAARIRQYNAANERCRNARETERRLLVDLLDLAPGLTICDVAAGGGYLSDGIYDRLDGRCRIVCIENSAHFSESLPDRYERLLCSLSDIELESATMDRVACLAGIHHQQDKQRFFDEAFRVLRPGGLLGVGDVLRESAPGRFLNEAVDRWSDLGHGGMFLAPGELTALMERAGFIEVTERVHAYTWNFSDFEELVWFCKTLFRMTKATLGDVETELRDYLQIDVAPPGARLHWTLTYASARKA